MAIKTSAPNPLPAHGSTELYWQDIKDSQPLSRDEEIEMFRRARQGDDGAQQKLLLANLRFVVSVARNYKDCGLPFIELISEGNIGLIEAARRFDETRGFKFITYAVWWIRQAILKVLAENGKITRPPMSQLNDLQKIEKERGRLANELGRPPTCEELAANLGISMERTRNALEVAQQTISLDAPVYENEKASLISVFSTEQEQLDKTFENAEMEKVLHSCLDILDTREHQIVRSYFGLESSRVMTMEEIGETMGITRERVRQLRNRALDKIRHRGGEQLAEFSRN